MCYLKAKFKILHPHNLELFYNKCSGTCGSQLIESQMTDGSLYCRSVKGTTSTKQYFNHITKLLNVMNINQIIAYIYVYMLLLLQHIRIHLKTNAK
jgi:hypothetical protein